MEPQDKDRKNWPYIQLYGTNKTRIFSENQMLKPAENLIQLFLTAAVSIMIVQNCQNCIVVPIVARIQW